ncbi:MAG TPA: VWA domain-containing protein [Terriglobia bacterium]|nr:VWA domain-containing protein [Terriglobia bacterium]
MQERNHSVGRTGRRIFSVLAVVLISAAMALAQGDADQPAPPKASTDAPGSTGDTQQAPAGAQIHIQSNLVTAPVTVKDKITGEFVYNLDEKDFQVYDNGKLQQITGFTRESHSISAVILIQTSDSVTPLLGEFKNLGPLFSELMLGPKGEAAVITFASEVKVAQGFSNSGAALDDTLRRLLPDGNKARMNDALMQAINLLQHRPKGERRVIVVFSSGYDSGSQTSGNEIIRRATAAEVEIYGMGLSLSKSYLTRDKEPLNPPTSAQNSSGATPPQPGRPTTPSTDMGTFGATVPATGAIRPAIRGAQGLIFSNDAEAFAQYTGGVFYSQWSAQALQNHLSQIAADVHSQYLLAYVPDNLSETGFHRVEVKVTRKGVKLNIRTRRGYFYEGSE